MDFLDPASWLGTVVILAVVLLAAAAVVLVVRTVLLRIAGRTAGGAALVRRLHTPSLIVVLVVALWVTSAATAPGSAPWWPAFSHLLLVVAILAGAWLLGTAVSLGFRRLIAHDSGGTDPESRSRRTQLAIIHRLSLVLISVLAVGAVLFSFPEMRIVGTSLLASAGIVSIVAGLAAQSLLGSLIAGIQIAFTEAIKVDDVVVVEGEWGRIGEINLSYVVVYIWDERRLVLPCTYFTAQPFETWTRNSDKVLGTVFMDLDWRVPMAEVRAKFQAIVEASPAWDRRASSVVVTDARNGFVTVRFVMSSGNSGDQWVLRCQVREEMMTWLQREHPEALPTTRFLATAGSERVPPAA